LVRGRDYVIPQDIVEVIPDVLRHRLVLTYDALADEVTPEMIINRILQTVAMPQVNAVPQQGHSVPPVMQTAAAASGR
jgi:MoxR-like ATPase